MSRDADTVPGGDAEARKQVENAASWFLWIAGLSFINSAVFYYGSEWSFIIGLGVTQLVDGIAVAVADEVGAVAKVAAVVIDVLAVAVFVVFGLIARKGHRWAFIVGMALYALDGLLFLVVQDYVGIAFHGLALFFLFRGLSACGRTEGYQETAASATTQTA